MSIAKFHAEWLNLLEINGPFVTLPVLTERLRSGLEPTDASLVAELRTAQTEVEDDPALHPVWARWVITDLLGFPPEVLREGAGIGPTLTHRVAEHSETLRPDFAIIDHAADGTERPRLLINIWPAGTDLTERPEGERWAAGPIDRIAELCRATTVRLGLVTNGNEWTLVDAPAGATTGTATWDATLWLEERATLDAFTTLVGVRRFFTVADNETLEALLMQSANAEAEVTDQLGKQVRAAVELLVDAMSRADRERGGSVFRDLAQAELEQDLEPYIYEAAVTVLMRLVFLLSAEERGLFLLGDPTYDATYAVSTLLAQLDDDSNRYGEDVLERRTDAWHRLLATFRMVYGGAAHANLRLPPYGGSLFDPDRFPFLEGRRPDQPENEHATPLRIDNRTVKHILDALQVLRFRGKGGWQEARRLSFRSLGVEQIGHVYEGLLDHGVVPVTADAVALIGKNDPEVALALIEEAAAKGHDALVSWLAELTGDKPKAVEKALAAIPEPDHLDRLASACDNDPNLAARIAPYLGMLRTDLRGLPQVFLPDSYYVTKSSDRRSSGAYYTPRALAEEMVAHTLEPLVYRPGPAEGVEPDQWELKPSLELLDVRICDMAMGSGVFLVSACRYLSERLLEAWDTEVLVPGELIPLPGGATTPMPDDETDREILARRLVVDRCLYGVDRNSMAVEMAKLSLWLVTLAKDRPFTFVDHALRCGDSLLGITDLRQLDSFHLDPSKGRELHGGTLFDPSTQVEPLVKAALEKRSQLESFTVIDIRDAERKRRLLDESSALLDDLKVVGDLVVGAALSTATSGGGAYETRLQTVAGEVASALEPDRIGKERASRLHDLRLRAAYWLDEGRPAMTPARLCFHWPLEFPEVFLDRRPAGFDAIIGNPPFLGGKRISGPMGNDFREHLVSTIANGVKGNSDLVGYFFLRAAQISSRLGLLSTDSIAQGDTRQVGLDQFLRRGWTITRAVKSMTWPGGASLEIAKVWIQAQNWSGAFVLDGEPVAGINSLLDEVGDVEGNPEKLRQPFFAFQGSNLAHSGFVLSMDEADGLLSSEPHNGDVVRPYVSARDLNERPDHAPSRYVIDFQDMSMTSAERYPKCLEILRQRVLPDVEEKTRSYPGWLDRWWQFWNNRAASYKAIESLGRVIGIARVSNTLQPAFIPTGSTYDVQLVIFATDSDAAFGALSSSFHWWWVFRYGSKRGVGGAPRYTPTDCFETLPLPPDEDERLRDAGRHLNESRVGVMRERQEGLTKIYNRIHDSGDVAEDICDLRTLHVQLDYAVAAAFGWRDLDLDHGFHETRLGPRHTIGPTARSEALKQLLILNHDRFALQASMGTKRPRSRVPSSGRGGTVDEPRSLFD